MIATSGSESPPPSTLGGPGFIPRERSHEEELGRTWAQVGYRSEAAPLRRVLLVRPGAVEEVRDPNAALMLAPVSCARLDANIMALAATYERLGVEVSLAAAPRELSANAIFARDTFVATPRGVVVARMASEQRAGEERFVAAQLAARGVPIVYTMTGAGSLEGADVLWVADDTVLVGVGRRTSAAATSELAAVLKLQGVRVECVQLSPRVQHLLGAVAFAAPDLACVNGLGESRELTAALERHGHRVVVLPDEDGELSRRRAMNFVAVRPAEIVMPSGAPRTRRRLEAAGLRCHEVDVDECIKAAGGVACLSGIIHRES